MIQLRGAREGTTGPGPISRRLAFPDDDWQERAHPVTRTATLTGQSSVSATSARVIAGVSAAWPAGQSPLYPRYSARATRAVSCTVIVTPTRAHEIDP